MVTVRRKHKCMAQILSPTHASVQANVIMAVRLRPDTLTLIPCNTPVLLACYLSAQRCTRSAGQEQGSVKEGLRRARVVGELTT